MINTKCKMVHVKDGHFAPKLCDCGFSHPIGGNATILGSYFWDPIHAEWSCRGCGMVI